MVSNRFVAISGVSDGKQLKSIYRICQEEGIEFPISIGYQVSNKSINQGIQNARQPRFIELGDLNKQALEYGFIPSIHYYTRDSQAIIRDLEKVTEIGVNPNSSLLQFNTLPLSEDVLRRVKKMGFDIIFKVAVSDQKSGGYAVWKGGGVQDVQDGRVSPLLGQVQERRKVIDYAMFDPSHGTNLDLDLDENSLAVRFGKEIVLRDNLNHLGLVYAGGINPKNVVNVTRSLISFFPKERISIDIESGVRGNNKFNLDLVRDYLLGFQSIK